MSLSKNCKNQLLNTLTGKANNISVASECHIGLLTSEPTFDGYHEVTGAGYKRTLFGHYQSKSSQAMSEVDDTGKSSNVNTVFFPEAESDWGTVTHFALFNSATEGTPHLWGELTTPVDIYTGYVPLFKEGALSITLT